MKVVMIGTGYVGLVTGTCFADSGNDVTCVDVNPKIIDRLKRGEVPIYEPGLKEMIEQNVAAERLAFTTDYAQAVPGAKCVFICVVTPPKEDGSADLKYVEAAARSMAPHLADDAIVVVKSTVPVGTNARVAAILREETGREVDVASNPEFLKEGAAIEDFTKPDRVVVGVTRPEVGEVLKDLYEPFLRTAKPFLAMGRESAEMTKYVANCLLATKISFINEMANLCERVGADINEVRHGIGHDERIGFHFLFPGVGYGGSCFPKDVRALIDVAADKDLDMQILKSVDRVNEQQKSVLFQKITKHFGGKLRGRTITLWGLAFKPNTDDIREAPSCVLIDALLKEGVTIRVHDPVAMDRIQEDYGDRLVYCPNMYRALDGAEALAICTEWKPFRRPDFDRMKKALKSPVIFDGRNLYDPKDMVALGFQYSGIGLLVPSKS